MMNQNVDQGSGNEDFVQYESYELIENSEIVDEDDDQGTRINSGARSRQRRTTTRQHEIYIAELEKNPCLLDAFDRGHPMAWKRLVKNLNELEPKKTLPIWKKNLKDWEYSLKTKYRKAQKETSETQAEMSNFEMRALRAFGEINVVPSKLPTLGFGAPCSVAPSTSSNVSSNSLPDNEANENRAEADEQGKEETPQKKRQRRDSFSSGISDIVHVLSEQNNIQAKNAESFSTFAKAFMLMVEKMPKSN